MKKHSSQQGSAHVIVTVCLVLGLITALGWIFYQNFVYKEVPQKDTELVIVEKDGVEKDKNQEPSEPEEEETPKPDETEPTLNVQYAGGVSIVLPEDFGTLLSWASTSEIANLSSEKVLSKEKELYGDAELVCQARDYALGRISVKDESTPYPGHKLVKKLASGQYLFYADDSKDSACYKRAKLRNLIANQVEDLKTALKSVK